MQGLGALGPEQRETSGLAAQVPPFDCTEFVAETLLPTVSGKYRLRGYRHTVSRRFVMYGILASCLDCRLSVAVH